MVHRFRRLDLDGPRQLPAPIRRRQHEIREELDLPHPHRERLGFTDVGYDFPLPLEADLQKADDAVVLELLAHGAHEDGAHKTSRRRNPIVWIALRSYSGAIIARTGGDSYTTARFFTATVLTMDVLTVQNDAVISSAEGSSTESATRTILIVDDDRSVADTFARMLKLEGFRVATALSAETGLELADTVNPDAIILDMRMPITNGLQFLRMIRAKPHLASVPVAIVTGDYFLSEPIQHELKSLGASIRFKPLWLEDLIALARTLIS
jgi:CheY-like chemotaxis protein